MKTINKIALFIFTCVTLSNMPINCFYYNDDPGANALGGAATGAFVGGLAGGGRGAAIGAGVGAGVGLMSAAARDNRRRRYDDYYYERKNRSRHSRKQQDLEAENKALRQKLQQYENEENMSQE